MTLDTSLIERESRELYMRFIKDPRIPDDLCSEIYMEFVEKINKEKASGIKRIDRGGIGQLIRLAVQTIFHKNKKQLEKDSVLNGIVGRDASRLWCINKSEKEREFFAKIALFLKDWVKRKKNYPDYLYVFMLYHSFHLSPDFIDELGPLTGRDGKKLQAELDDLKEKIRIRVGDKLEKKLQILGAQYYLLVKKQHLPGGLFIEEYNCSQRDYRESKKKRAQALEAIGEAKFFPTWVQVSEITTLSVKMASYAYQMVIKAIKESFKDDTYWGSAPQ